MEFILRQVCEHRLILNINDEKHILTNLKNLHNN